MLATFAGIRFLHFICAMLLFGGPLYLRHLRRRVPAVMMGPVRAEMRSVVGAAIAGLAAAAALLPATAANMAGSTEALTDSDLLWSVVSVTEFGWIWLAHMLTGIVLLPLALRWPARDGALVIVAGLYLATAALQGHGLPGSGLTRIAGGFAAVLHMAAAAAWLGSLVPLWFISLAAAEGDGINAADALRRYAPWGTAAVCLLVPAGLVLIITIEGGLVWTASDYEWLIAIKFLLVGLMLSLAAYNRFILRPRLFAGQVPGAAGQMRLSIIAEITLGLAVVGLVAILGLLDPPQAGG